MPNTNEKDAQLDQGAGSQIIWIGKPPQCYPHLSCPCGEITLDVEITDDPACKACGRKHSLNDGTLRQEPRQ
jgi:hypothetical protein